MQIEVRGFKQVETYASDRIKVYRDKNTIYVTVNGQWTNLSTEAILATTTLKPKGNQVVMAHPSISTNKVGFATDGQIRYFGTTGTVSIYTSFYLPIA